LKASGHLSALTSTHPSVYVLLDRLLLPGSPDSST